MRELTSKIEEKLSGSLGAKIPGVDLSGAGASSLSKEQKTEIVEHGQRAVSEIQVRELENIITVLAEDIFKDPQEHFYLTIDMLDEEWVDDRIKYKLIKALIDTLRRFRKVKNVKVIAALRHDLLDKVIHSSREPGFQEEKYESLYLNLRWNKQQLYELIEKRINKLIKRKYKQGDVSFSEIFHNNVDKTDSFTYMVERTFQRPRDIITFFNECIAMADGKPRITGSMVKNAEEQYSYKRLQSLATEWLGVYPNLYCVAKMFSGMKSNFRVSDITKEFLEEKYTEAIDNATDIASDPITAQIDRLYTGNANFNSVRTNLVRELYLVGLIGVKSAPSSSVNWAYTSRMSLSPGEVKPSSIIEIHPMFYRALDIKMNKEK